MTQNVELRNNLQQKQREQVTENIYKKTEEHLIKYKRKTGNAAKNATKTTKTLLRKISYVLREGMTGRQRLWFKIFKQQQVQERDKVKIDRIIKQN
jgi:hypothetical protein